MSYLDADGGAVYRIFDEAGALLYIGSTGDVRARMRQHLTTTPATPTAEAIRARYHRHEVAFFTTLGQARAAEFDAIAAEAPELNEKGHNGRLTSDIDTAVRELAAEKGVSICEMAYRADMDVRNLNRLLVTREIYMSHLGLICDLLGVEVSELIAQTEDAA